MYIRTQQNPLEYPIVYFIHYFLTNMLQPVFRPPSRYCCYYKMQLRLTVSSSLHN